MTTMQDPLVPLGFADTQDRHPKAHRLITASRIGETNRGRVLETLHMGGPSSRAQLARALNVNRATIASILQPLIDAGILVEGTPVSTPSRAASLQGHCGSATTGPYWAVYTSPRWRDSCIDGI
ncbi:MarR family winged helix-turn-helix transcriptional regulator [Arthrobacter alpinus]|nr:MarR family winged helix-turn-helix transcriptional regulator [Arthrobacter alpinus]